MKTVNRLMANICSEHLMESKDFYMKLFDFEVNFDSDWFIHLISKDKQLELGLIDKTNELVPEKFRNKPQGFYLTFVVESADAIYEIAKTENFEVVKLPKDTYYGQRRFLLKDPDGALVDVSSPISNFQF